jgi:hypothetical protein
MINWFFFLMFFPLSFFLEYGVKCIKFVWKSLKEVNRDWRKEGKERVIKEHSSLNRFQNRYLKGRPLWKEWLLNQIYRIWFPIRVRLEFYSTPFRLVCSFFFSWIIGRINWFFYESKILYSQWKPIKENRFFFQSLLKGIYYLIMIGLGLCTFLFFGSYFYPYVDELALIFLTKPFWFQLKGYFYVFFPVFLFFFIWFLKYLVSYPFKERSEDLTAKFRSFDLFDEFDGDRFYKRIKKEKDDFFMYEGGVRLSEWERKRYNQETELSPREGFKGEAVYKKKGALLHVGSWDLLKEGCELDELPLTDSMRNPYELSSYLQKIRKKKEIEWDDLGEEIYYEISPGNWQIWELGVKEALQDIDEDEEAKETFLWDPEFDFIGGREGDHEEERGADGEYHAAQEEDDWVMGFGIDSYFREKGMNQNLDWDEFFFPYSMLWESWAWYDEYAMELREAEEVLINRPFSGRLVELEWEGLQSMNWIPWTRFVHGYERWFDDPLEMLWIERLYELELILDEEEEEELDASYDSTADLDEGIHDLGMYEAYRIVDYMLFSIVLISYLFWEDMIAMGNPTDTRIVQTEFSKWHRPSNYSTDLYSSFLAEKRSEYIDPKLKKPIEDGKAYIRKKLGLKGDIEEYFKQIPSYLNEYREKVEKRIPGLVENLKLGKPTLKDSLVVQEEKNYELERRFHYPFEKTMTSKPSRQVCFTRKYLKEKVGRNAEEEGMESPFFTIFLNPYQPEVYGTKEMTSRETIYPLLDNGTYAQFDFFKENYTMEVLQVREGLWTVIDVCYTFWGTTLRMFRFLWLVLSSFFWFFIEGSSWGLQAGVEWYISFWWPFWWKCFSLLVWPISKLIEFYHLLFLWLKALLNGYLQYGPGWLCDISERMGVCSPDLTFSMKKDWLRAYFYSFDWWDSVSFSWGAYPKHNVVLFRVWWDSLSPNFFLVVLSSWFFFLVKSIFLGLQFGIDLLGLVWNLNVWVFVTLLHIWGWVFSHLLVVFFWLTYVLLWFLIKVFLWVC